jgi:hypothetical protein
MPRGRPRLPGTNDEKAEARKERTRKNVAAFRARQKELALQNTNSQPKTLTVILERPDSGSVKSVNSNLHGLCDKGEDTYASSTSLSKSTPISKLKGLAIRRQAEQQPDYPSPLGLGYIYQDSMLKILLNRYLPGSTSTMCYKFKATFAPNQDQHPVTCSTWLVFSYKATKQRQAEILNDSMLALALSIHSKENSNPQILHAARQVYSRALLRLQTSFAQLADPSSSSSSSSNFASLIGLSCLACAVSEMVANQCLTSLGKHLDGIGLLVQTRGPDALSSELDRTLFFEHRAMYIIKSVVERKSYFYSERAWIDFEWKRRNPNTINLFQSLLDIAYLIPEALEIFDRAHDVDGLLRLVEMVRDLDARLDAWERHTTQILQSPLSRPRVCTAASDPQLNPIEFATLGTAIAMLYFHAFKIRLAELLIDIVDALPEFEHDLGRMRAAARVRSLHHARIICASMEYCFDMETRLVGKLIALFPFDSACLAFRRLGTGGEGDGDGGFDGATWCDAFAVRFSWWGIPLLSSVDGSQRFQSDMTRQKQQGVFRASEPLLAV